MVKYFLHQTITRVPVNFHAHSKAGTGFLSTVYMGLGFPGGSKGTSQKPE